MPHTHEGNCRCSHPSPDELFLQVGGNIERSGFHVTGVLPSTTELPYAYTTGLLTSIGHPELVIIGVDPSVAHPVIWAVYDHLRDLKEPHYPPGGKVTGLLANEMPLMLEPVDLARTWMSFGVCSLWYRGSVPLEIWQIVLPDCNGLLPGDEGCDPAFVTGQRSVLS